MVQLQRYSGVDPLLTLLGDLAYYAGDADEAMMDNIGRKI